MKRDSSEEHLTSQEENEKEEGKHWKNVVINNLIRKCWTKRGNWEVFRELVEEINRNRAYKTEWHGYDRFKVYGMMYDPCITYYLLNNQLNREREIDDENM